MDKAIESGLKALRNIFADLATLAIPLMLVISACMSTLPSAGVVYFVLKVCAVCVIGFLIFNGLYIFYRLVDLESKNG